MIKEIRVIPSDIISHELRVKNQRLEMKRKMNIENLVKGALRSIGAIKVSVSDLKEKNGKASVVASFMYRDELKKATFNAQIDKFGNWSIKEFETSLNAAEVIENPNKQSKMVVPENSLIIDLSTIKAIQRGEEYSIEHPIIGKFATLKKDEINEKNIKAMFTLFANDTGANIKYINNFKVDFQDEDFTYEVPSYEEINSPDENIKAKNEIFYHTQSKSEDLKASIRENFDKVIKNQAANLVKQQTYSWKTGPAKILSMDSFVEIKDSKYTGNVVIKAKIGTQEKTFALPVEKGKIILKGDINNYIIDQKDFEDLVKKSIEGYLKEQLKKDLNHIAFLEAHDIATLKQTNINAIQNKNVIKKFPILRVNLEDIEIGDVINLNGIKYKVEAGDNDSYFNLVFMEV